MPMTGSHSDCPSRWRQTRPGCFSLQIPLFQSSQSKHSNVLTTPFGASRMQLGRYVFSQVPQMALFHRISRQISTKRPVPRLPPGTNSRSEFGNSHQAWLSSHPNALAWTTGRDCQSAPAGPVHCIPRCAKDLSAWAELQDIAVRPPTMDWTAHRRSHAFLPNAHVNRARPSAPLSKLWHRNFFRLLRLESVDQNGLESPTRNPE
jgi:hypothetical protein